MAVVAGSALVEGMSTAMEQDAVKLPSWMSREANR
jgi:hypothetical protein